MALPRPPCCEQFNQEHHKLGYNQVNIAITELGGKTLKKKYKKWDEEARKDAEYRACNNWHCVYCGAKVEDNSNIVPKIPEILKNN